MNWLYYLAEANLYLCVFYLAYCLFLAKETHYQLNRIFLLTSCVFAFVIPVLQVDSLKRPEATSAMHETMVTPGFEQLAMQADLTIAPVAAGTQTVVAPTLTYQDYLWWGYIAGASILLLIFAIKLFTVFKLTRNQKTKRDDCQVIYLPDTDVAFSFFNYLFIGVQANGADTIINHELVHIRQKHSADIIFLELIKVICWFNPCIYLLQNSLKTVHEYIADEQAAAFENDAITYSSFLVNNAYGLGGSSITHSFFNYNLLKKRIIMLNQQRSGKLARLKYLVAVPLCAGLLCASTLTFSKSYGWVNIGPAEKTIASPDTLVTSKGIKYKETVYTKNGHKVCDVTFYEASGKTETFSSWPSSLAKITLLKKQYGYEFPKGSFPPEPPLAPPVKKKMDVVKFPPPPPPPSFSAFGFEGLQHHIYKSISYKPRPLDKGTFVVLSFTINADNKITGAKVEKSGGSAFDTQSLNALNSYKLNVGDQPGKYKLVLSFYNGDKDQAAYEVKANDKSVIGVYVISPIAYKNKVTSKGYEYDEYGYLSGKKIAYQIFIYEKDGSVQKFATTPQPAAETVKMLKDKYGYTLPKEKVLKKLPFPSKPKVDSVTFPPRATGKLKSGYKVRIG